MKAGRTVVVALALAATMTVIVSGAGASGHPSYPLGRARSCRAHYVKRTERHRVAGKSVRFIACIYVVPPIAATTTTTTTSTTTTTLPIPASVVVNVEDPQLLVDYLAIGFNGLPTPPNVDAIPGDPVYLEGFVTDPLTSTPSGTITFSVNGVVVPSCVDVTVQSDGASPAKSEAQCSYQFNDSGTVTVGVTFQGTDGSAGSAQNSFTVATPDEVAIIDGECQLVKIGQC